MAASAASVPYSLLLMFFSGGTFFVVHGGVDTPGITVSARDMCGARHADIH